MRGEGRRAQKRRDTIGKPRGSLFVCLSVCLLVCFLKLSNQGDILNSHSFNGIVVLKARMIEALWGVSNHEVMWALPSTFKGD